MKNIKLYYILIASSIFHLSFRTNKDGIALSTDSTPIYYRTYGSGNPLLIINGGPGMNRDGFEGLAKKLSGNNLAIIYDQRGTGRSSLKILNTTTITMQLMIDDIESILKKLKIEKWSVLGHSFGGMVASYYATQHPEHIEKIILSSSGGIDLDLLNYVQESINLKLSKIELDSISYWNKKIADGDTDHFAKLRKGINLAHAYVIDKKFIPIIGERLTQGNQTINLLMWTNMQNINFNCFNDLKTFTKPVLIIQGKQDIIKPETAERAHQAFRNSKVVFMEHCIHYGWLDNEEVYFNEINSFLGS